MKTITTPVTLRQLIPSEGMCIHRIEPSEYYYDFKHEEALSPYLGKDESEDNYEEVPIGDIPRPEPPEEVEETESEEDLNNES